MLSRRTVLGILLITVAVLYQWYCPQSGDAGDMVPELAKRWEEEIKRPQRPLRKIAVG